LQGIRGGVDQMNEQLENLAPGEGEWT